MKKVKLKQILAITAIVILVGLYLVSFILAFIKSEWATKMLQMSLVTTAFVSVVGYLLIMFYKLSNRNNDDVNNEK